MNKFEITGAVYKIRKISEKCYACQLYHKNKGEPHWFNLKIVGAGAISEIQKLDDKSYVEARGFISTSKEKEGKDGNNPRTFFNLVTLDLKPIDPPWVVKKSSLSASPFDKKYEPNDEVPF